MISGANSPQKCASARLAQSHWIRSAKQINTTAAYADYIFWSNQRSSTTNYAVTSLDSKQIKIKNDISEWIQKSNTERKLHTLYSK